MIKFKHKKQMKKEKIMKKTKLKTKCLKILLLVIAIILCIFIAIVTRRTIILSEIDKKVTELENNSNNFYMKTTFIDEENYTASIERYIKDDVSKLVMKKKLQMERMPK